MNNLNSLIISKKNFIFDPSTGESFLVNTTGLVILNGLRKNQPMSAIARDLVSQFDVSTDQAEKDVAVFLNELKKHALL